MKERRRFSLQGPEKSGSHPLFSGPSPPAAAFSGCGHSRLRNRNQDSCIGESGDDCVASLVYLLFPADTTRILLVHTAHIQEAMTFLLLGIWMWLRGGWTRVLSYPVATLCLLSYETTLLPFGGAALCRSAVVEVCEGGFGASWNLRR